MMVKTASSVLLAMGLSLGGAAAHAAAQSYSFSECLSGCSGSVSSLGTLVVTDLAGGNGVSFSLTATLPAGSFIDYLKFNGPGGSFAAGSGGGLQTIASGAFGSSTDVSLPFSWKVNFPNGNGKKSDRFLNGDVAMWTIKGSGLDVSDFAFGSGSPMLLHVNAFGIDSVKLGPATAPVPEPQTYAMLLAGLGLLGAAARKRLG